MKPKEQITYLVDYKKKTMDNLIKQKIAEALKSMNDGGMSYEKIATPVERCSPSTISQMCNGKWDLISNEMWYRVKNHYRITTNWQLVTASLL